MDLVQTSKIFVYYYILVIINQIYFSYHLLRKVLFWSETPSLWGADKYKFT